MNNDGKGMLDAWVRMSCIIAPPGLFSVFIRLFGARIDMWKYVLGGCVLLAWSVVICIRTGDSVIGKPLRRGFIASFIQQAFLVFFSGAMLIDGGVTFCACIFASMLYWIIVGVVLAHRPISPTSFDHWLITYSFLVLAFVMVAIFWILVNSDRETRRKGAYSRGALSAFDGRECLLPSCVPGYPLPARSAMGTPTGVQTMICIAKTDPTPDCLFAYTGRPFDKEVGLQSNELRHYDPTVGRWLSEEHIGYRPDGNLYRYPVNRPE